MEQLCGGDKGGNMMRYCRNCTNLIITKKPVRSMLPQHSSDSNLFYCPNAHNIAICMLHNIYSVIHVTVESTGKLMA